MRQHLPFIAILIILTSLGYFATDIYLPSLPAISESFAVDSATTQYTLSAYLLSFCISPLIFGPLSDAIGRKPVYLWGLVFGLCATILCAFASHIEWLIVARFLQGIGLGAVVTGGRAMVPDKFHGQKMAKFTSIVTMSMPLILAIAPTLGGVLQHAVGWRGVFAFLVIYIFATLLFAYFKVEETLKEKRRFHFPARNYIRLLTNRDYIAYGLIPSCTFMGVSAYIALTPFIFQDQLGVSPIHYGLFSLLNGSMIVMGGYINMLLVDKFRPNILIGISIGLKLTSGLFLLACHALDAINVLTVLLSCVIFFIGLPFSFPNALASAFRCIKGDFGTAGALISSLQLFAGFAMITVYTQIPQTNTLPLSLTFIGVGLVCALLLAFTHDPGIDPSPAS